MLFAIFMSLSLFLISTTTFASPIQGLGPGMGNVWESACSKDVDKVLAGLKNYTTCKSDSDCKLFTPGCPFGCGVYPVSKSFEFEKTKEMLEYKKSCRTNRCDYKCAGPNFRGVLCIKNICVGQRQLAGEASKIENSKSDLEIKAKEGKMLIRNTIAKTFDLYSLTYQFRKNKNGKSKIIYKFTITDKLKKDLPDQIELEVWPSEIPDKFRSDLEIELEHHKNERGMVLKSPQSLTLHSCSRKDITPVVSAFKNYASCDKDSDCKLIHAGCPFGSDDFAVNVDFEIENMREMNEFKGDCLSGCDSFYFNSSIKSVKCINGTCTGLKAPK